MGKKNNSLREIDRSGEQWNCRSCGERMVRWRHSKEWTPPTDKGYFRFWFECVNPKCRTRQVMPKQGFVPVGGARPESPPTQGEPLSAEADLCAEDLQRLAHFREM